jgi:hypothetical protein
LQLAAFIFEVLLFWPLKRPDRFADNPVLAATTWALRLIWLAMLAVGLVAFGLWLARRW